MAHSPNNPPVETVRGIYESFADGDIDAVAATWAPDIELREPAGFVGGGTLHGETEIREMLFERMANEWEDVSVTPQRFIDGGDTVVAEIVWRGTFAETGNTAEFRGAHVFDFEDGAIVRWTSYADTALFNAARQP